METMSDKTKKWFECPKCGEYSLDNEYGECTYKCGYIPESILEKCENLSEDMCENFCNHFEIHELSDLRLEQFEEALRYLKDINTKAQEYEDRASSKD